MHALVLLECQEIRQHVAEMDLNSRSEDLREGLGENEAISKLAQHEIGRNNTKDFACCSTFSSCLIRHGILVES